jgi:hypothetical protein
MRRKIRPFRRASEAMALVLAIAGAAPTFSLPRAASAETKKTAAQLKAEGDKAFDTFSYEEAITAYDAAYELSHDPALLFNRGRALQALGRYPEALTMFERFETEAPEKVRAKVPGLPKLIAEVRSKVATLRVTCNVPNAEVVVGDRVLGEAGSLGDVRMNAGTVTLKVQREGYLPFRREVTLNGGGTSTVEVELKLRATTGTLAIVTDPPAARVSVDGKPQGNSPIEVSLPEGPHTIALERDGYEPLQSKAVVKADGRVDMRLTMQALPGITSRWWFWAGAGAIVVSGVVIGIALTTDRSAPSGNFSPPRVSAPLIRF